MSAGPVDMMRHRLILQGLQGRCIRGSVLNLPIPSASMDFVVSIGCFHHTGNVQQAINETYRVLKPEGIAVIMVYNQFSYRQWLLWPRLTFRAWLGDMGFSAGQIKVSDEQRRLYDSNSEGGEAPETVFLSIAQVRHMLTRYTRVEFHKENFDDLLGWMLRKMFLQLNRMLARFVRVEFHEENVGNQLGKLLRKNLLLHLGRSWGLDIYIEV